MNKVFIQSDGCWQWLGSTDKDGYGKFKVEGKDWRAHRWIYENKKGSLGDLLCCHTCDNPSCVNPDHLFKGTRVDNEQDKIQKKRHDNQKKTHCPQGHEYSERNIIKSGTGRKCRICQDERDLGRKRWKPECERKVKMKLNYTLP